MQKTRYHHFTENYAQDLLIFVFFLFLFFSYRAAFISSFSAELAQGTSSSDIWLALWYGLRMSLKSAAALAAPAFLFATLPVFFSEKWPAKKIRFAWGVLAIMAISVLFQIRIPYYREFHGVFDPAVLNDGNYNLAAITVKSIKYMGFGRLIAALGLGAGFAILLRQWVSLGGLLMLIICSLENRTGKMYARYATIAAMLLFLGWIALFSWHGGSLKEKGAISLENYQRFSQRVLNDAVLDEVQSIYRSHRIYKQSLQKTEE